MGVYSFKASRQIFYANSLEKTEYIIRFYKGIIKEKPNTRKRIVKCLFRRVLLLNKIFVNSYIIFTIFI